VPLALAMNSIPAQGQSPPPRDPEILQAH
jgi:hypothetical protein